MTPTFMQAFHLQVPIVVTVGRWSSSSHGRFRSPPWSRQEWRGAWGARKRTDHRRRVSRGRKPPSARMSSSGEPTALPSRSPSFGALGRSLPDPLGRSHSEIQPEISDLRRNARRTTSPSHTIIGTDEQVDSAVLPLRLIWRETARGGTLGNVAAVATSLPDSALDALHTPGASSLPSQAPTRTELEHRWYPSRIDLGRRCRRVQRPPWVGSSASFGMIRWTAPVSTSYRQPSA